MLTRQRFIALCDELTTKNINTLVSGRITDFAGYKQVVGRIQGINEVREAVVAESKKPDEDE